MQQPWNIKPEDLRTADSLPTFIIFCEDEVSEHIYFKYFETAAIKVNPIPGQKSKIENVLKAITHCVSEGLIQHLSDGKTVLNKNDVQVWCVFDRDKESIPHEEALGNTKFNQSIQTAINNGIQMAWSNDAFELWVLLHFENIDPANHNSQLRATYYARLTEIFRTLPNPNTYLQKAMLHASFSYKKDLKSEKNFRNIVRPAIIEKTQIESAINRAKFLVSHHDSIAKPPHEKAPCTLVHTLVEELIRLGGKKL